MFELLFAWTVFTVVLGKSAEALTHAWKGTVPPGHARRMARIREREAKAARADLKPSTGFRGWARTVWADSWNAATERHRERWPHKAAKKAEYARRRWAWWDGVEEEAGRRWEKRRAARDASSTDPATAAEPPETGGSAPTADTPDTPDSAPKTPGEGTVGGVRGPRTPGHRPVSGAEPTIPSTRPDTTEGADDMAEVMNLSGATKFTRALHKNYTASTERLEEVMAWLHSQNITSGTLHDRFRAILRTTADTAALTEEALKTCEDQLKVRDAIEASGGVALSKEALQG